MISTRTWTVQVILTEDEGRTRADAILHAGGEEKLRGAGHARLNPADTDVPEIGDELATSRALSDLAHRLLDAAATDIEAVTHQPARLTH